MFVDSNVLVYARVLEAPLHNVARERLRQAYFQGEPLRINRQVLREYLATVTRPQDWEISITRTQAIDDVQSLSDTLEVLEDGPQVTEMLISLCRQVNVGGKQIHDANIVATMLAHGERRLLTFNRADFSRYEDQIEVVEG